MYASIMLACLAAAATSAVPQDTVFKAPLIQVRTEKRDGKEFHYLMYNRIYLGRNYLKPRNPADRGDPAKDFSRLATTYYHDKSPIGVVLQKYNWAPGKDNTYHADARMPASLIALAGLDPYGQLGQLANLWSEPPIAVLGMEIGTMASYARPMQPFHFTERVPTFVKLSLPDKGDKRYFHYVQDALDRGAYLQVRAGEPRESFEKHGGANFYQAIVVETFTLPDAGLHKELMTKEALQMLMSKVRADGIVCFHTSNRHYDLVPIIASAAKELKFACLVGKDMGDYHSDPGNDHRFVSEWVMVARHDSHLAYLKTQSGKEIEWSIPPRTHKKFVWTDKGGQSLRGVYRSDPEIDKYFDVLHDAQDLLREKFKVSNGQLYRIMQPIGDLIRAASQMSANSLNRGAPGVAKPDSYGRTTLFEAPRIQVIQERADKHEYLYLMYNGTYLGRNYRKPKDEALHGDRHADLSRLPTTYFHDKSPIGVVLRKDITALVRENTYYLDARLPASMVCFGGQPAAQLVNLWSEPPIAVVGMDVGSLASYARPAQTMHFFERMPEFVQLSFGSDDEPPLFHYVPDALKRGACVKAFEGEPRPSMEKHAGDGFYQLISINTYRVAVSTVHKELMTKEGMKMLMGKTRDDGILCYHASNRYYDLVPVLASAAKELGYAVVVGNDFATWKDDTRRDRFTSQWVMIARKKEHLIGLRTPEGFDKAERWKDDPFWGPPQRVDKKFVWTDKGENSFRGIYERDPMIDAWRGALYNLERAIDPSHRLYRHTQPLHDAFSTWSQSSAAAMNRQPPNQEKD